MPQRECKFQKLCSRTRYPVTPAPSAYTEPRRAQQSPELPVAIVLSSLAFYASRFFQETSPFIGTPSPTTTLIRKLFAESLRGGKLRFSGLPAFSGFPFCADLQTGAWYPLNWPPSLPADPAPCSRAVAACPRSRAGRLPALSSLDRKPPRFVAGRPDVWILGIFRGP
jgi:hypothetical protein